MSAGYISVPYLQNKCFFSSYKKVYFTPLKRDLTIFIAMIHL